MTAVIVWFRNDLRLEDNPALTAAKKSGLDVVPIYVLDDVSSNKWLPASASRYWLHRSLSQLQSELRQIGSHLILRKGETHQQLEKLISECNAKMLVWNRRYEPDLVEQDKSLKSFFQKNEIEVRSFKANLLYEPHEIKNRQGKPFKVFTPFWKHYQTLPEVELPLARPDSLRSPGKWPETVALDELHLKPEIKWYRDIDKNWQYGSAAAINRLSDFIGADIEDYDEQRNFPAVKGISCMSPYLHFGEISARMIWHQVRQSEHQAGLISASESVQPYLRQLVWREFAHHLLYHFPYSSDKAWRSEYDHFPWKENKKQLKQWQIGQTGYPIVDAGMRELWATGWMHNRVRMIVASFLVKDLLIHWKKGAEWFWDTLLDADLANNTMGWQWVAGSGADAAPYFRIFNPVSQGERFDPDGVYVRKWLPELTACSNKYIHKPWQDTGLLKQSGIVLGRDYPEPMIDHAVARKNALAALQEMKARKIK